MVALASKLELQGFLWRNFYSKRTGIANPMFIAPITPKIQASKISYDVLHCTSKYVKEKKKMTIFTKYHGDLLTTMSDCLFNPICTTICIETGRYSSYVLQWNTTQKQPIKMLLHIFYNLAQTKTVICKWLANFLVSLFHIYQSLLC